MTALLLEPFSYGYMTNAMWVSALVGGVCAFLSCFLMLKGWSLIGDALSHSVVPGVAGAYMLGLPFALGAFLSGGLAAAAMLLLTERSGLKPDVIIGLIFTSFFGLGLFTHAVSSCFGMCSGLWCLMIFPIYDICLAAIMFLTLGMS
mgnify:CR=1 FL=1